jgi:hypothetical protein
MSDGKKTNDDGSPGFKNEATGTYESSTGALKEIKTAFDYWSGQVTATSLQMCYGLIAANWVVFGSVRNILHSGYAGPAGPGHAGAHIQHGVRVRVGEIHEDHIRLRSIRPKGLGGGVSKRETQTGHLALFELDASGEHRHPRDQNHVPAGKRSLSHK